jgi:plasmid stabilization system protein ParE
MTYPLDFSNFAEADLAEAVTWYSRIRPGLAADLVLCVEEALDRICQHPESFPPIAAGIRRAIIHRFPYSVIFRLRHGRIEVLAVFHARRDPIGWQSRLR